MQHLDPENTYFKANSTKASQSAVSKILLCSTPPETPRPCAKATSYIPTQIEDASMETGQQIYRRFVRNT